MDYALDELIKLGAEDFDHLNGSLLEHLKGTRQLLSKWGNREELCNAGLYHSIYGTQGYVTRIINPDSRAKIISIIGEEAERIVYYFSVCDRDFLYLQISPDTPTPNFRNRITGEEESLDEAMAKDLLELTLANELEIFITAGLPLQTWAPLFKKFRNYVSDAGFQEILDNE